jgi:2-oxoisovalerate ferredoxin oxidoreductase beta subunit
MKGFRFFHILAPCPTGWAYRAEKTIEMARLAVETRLFPLYEIENGVYSRINREPSGVSVQEYVQAQGRFRSLTSEQISSFQQDIDQKWWRLQHLMQSP